MNDDERNEIFKEELKTIEYLLEKCNIAMEQIKQGNIEDFKETVDALYLESVDTISQTVLSFTKIIIIHLFKLKYGWVEDSYDSLRKEIREHRNNIQDLTDWDLDKKKKNVLDKVYPKIEITYRRAKANFQGILDDPKESKYYRIKTTSGFPSDCPWTLEQLIDYPIERLLEIWDNWINMRLDRDLIPLS